MKYQRQRVDLRDFLQSEVPKSALPEDLRRRVRHAVDSGAPLQELARDVAEELLRRGILRPAGSFREGPDRIPVYAIGHSSRVFDLRRLLQREEPATPPRPPEPEPTPPPATSAPEPRPAVPTVTPGNGSAQASLLAIQRTLQRDWVSYGPEASLAVVLEELGDRLDRPDLHLHLWTGRLPFQVEEGERWTLHQESEPRAGEWLQRMHTLAGPFLEREREVWVPVRLGEEIVGAMVVEPGVGRDLLLTASETVTALLGALQRSRRRVYTDALTGLNNRSFFEQQIGVELERATRQEQELALLFADIDHFKRFNDEHGHDSGDLVLQHVARLMLEHLRRIDSVFRWGGEEFALLLPATGMAQAEFIANRLRVVVEETPVVLPGGRELRVTLSIGIAVAPRHAAGGEKELLRHADQALYEAKRQGRNRVCTADH